MVVATYDDDDASGRISSGDTIRFSNEDCDGAVLDFRMEVTAAEVSESGIVALAGSLKFSTTVTPETSGDASEFEGSLNLDHKVSEADKRLGLAEIETSATRNGRTDELTEGRLEEVIADLKYTVDFAGHMDSDVLEGVFDFETETTFAGSLGSFPTAGDLQLDAGNSSVSVKPSANPELKEHADYRIDTAGTGQYGAAEAVRWLDLMSGSLFNWHSLIRALFVDPPHPLTTASLIAVPLIYNPQGNELSLDYEWNIDDQVVRSNVWPYFVPVYVLPAGFTKKGNEVEVRLTATEGEKTVSKSASTTIRNSPPELTVTLSPEQPETTDDIVLNYDAEDADGDGLATRYEWRINDEVISDETAKTLPADRHKKHDVISVAVTTGDGEAETQAEANVTIEDAKPRVAVADSPEAVTFGSRVEFDATISDPDGDDVSGVRFAVDYGPPGMTVDPLSGRVAWTAGKLPMFDREMEVGWQVGSSSHAVASVSGTFRVVDPDRQYPLIRSGIDRTRFHYGLRVADLDGDGDVEMLNSGFFVVHVLDWSDPDYVQSWAYPFPVDERAHSATANSYVEGTATADIDGDGRHEIFLIQGDTVVRLDGVERRLAASAMVTPSDTSPVDIEVADLDGDGTSEVVYVRQSSFDDANLVVLSADDLSIVRESPQGQLGSLVEIGNVDRDPALEIVISSGDVYDGSTFVKEWSHESHLTVDRPHYSRIGIGDIDGDGIEEVIGALDRENPAFLQAYDIASGETLGDIAQHWGSNNRLAVADIDGDNVAEVLVGGYRRIIAYRFDRREEKFTEIFNEEVPTSVEAIDVGDVDNDGEIEIVLVGHASFSGDIAQVVAGLNPDFEIEWTGEPLEGPFRGGRFVSDGNTSPQLLFVSGSRKLGTMTVYLSDESGELTVGPRVVSDLPRASVWYATDAYISDYDQDATDELLLSLLAPIHGPRLVAFDPFRAIHEWSFTPKYGGRISGANDVNGDGSPDLLTPRAVYDVMNDSVILEPENWEHVLDIASGDLDGDGIAEIVTAIDRSPDTDLILYSRTEHETAFTRTARSYSDFEVFDLLASDSDGDGKDELFMFARNRPYSQRSVHRLGPDLELLNSFPVLTGQIFSRDHLFVLPADKGREHLLVTVTRDGTKVVAYDPATGGKIWESPKLIGSISPNSLHHFEEGGETRLVIGTSRAMYITR